MNTLRNRQRMSADHVGGCGGGGVDLRIGGTSHAGAAMAAQQRVRSIAIGINIRRVRDVLGRGIAWLCRRRLAKRQEDRDHGEETWKQPLSARPVGALNVLPVYVPCPAHWLWIAFLADSRIDLDQ
jgi:hypothetical protein